MIDSSQSITKHYVCCSTDPKRAHLLPARSSMMFLRAQTSAVLHRSDISTCLSPVLQQQQMERVAFRARIFQARIGIFWALLLLGQGVGQQLGLVVVIRAGLQVPGYSFTTPSIYISNHSITALWSGLWHPESWQEELCQRSEKRIPPPAMGAGLRLWVQGWQEMLCQAAALRASCCRKGLCACCPLVSTSAFTAR